MSSLCSIFLFLIILFSLFRLHYNSTISFPLSPYFYPILSLLSLSLRLSLYFQLLFLPHFLPLDRPQGKFVSNRKKGEKRKRHLSVKFKVSFYECVSLSSSSSPLSSFLSSAKKHNMFNPVRILKRKRVECNFSFFVL